MILNSHCQIRESVTEPVVVVLHGLFGSWDNWGRQIKRLAEKQSMIGLDLRNHGKSPHSSAMDYDCMSEDVLETLEHLQVTQASILGHSMGGKTALAIAGKLGQNHSHKLALKSLIIVDIAPRAHKPTHLAILDAMNSLDTANLKSRKDADSELASQIKDATTRQFLLKNLQRAKQGGYRWGLNLEAITQAYPKLLETPECPNEFSNPLLLIRGSESDYVTDSDVEKMRTWASRLECHTINGAGHWPHASHSTDTTQLLSTFLIKHNTHKI